MWESVNKNILCCIIQSFHSDWSEWKFLMYCSTTWHGCLSQFIIILSSQLMLDITFMFDEFRMSLNSLWVKWLVWCWRQNWKFPTKHTRREIHLPAPTVWLCLFQTCLWKTEGIWLDTVAKYMIFKNGPVALIMCKFGLFLFTFKSMPASPSSAYSVPFHSSSHFLEWLVTFSVFFFNADEPTWSLN